jgi:hypothetical protein
MHCRDLVAVSYAERNGEDGQMLLAEIRYVQMDGIGNDDQWQQVWV